MVLLVHLITRIHFNTLLAFTKVEVGGKFFVCNMIIRYIVGNFNTIQII